VGAATVNEFGGSTEQVLGGALKGAQIANPDTELGNALGTQADSLLSRGADNEPGGAESASAGSASGAANYPVQPPVDMGEACSAFTESNYRTVAVNAPGDDAHLYAACGQAFELYSMYKNAIKQGYSEAESMRTYQAHVGAARNAMDYFQTRRAR
jgi:hypothetical protein